MDARAPRPAETELMLRAVCAETTDVVFVRDLQGRYLMLNQRAAEVNGKQVEELLGRDDTVLFPPDIARQLREDDERVIRAGKTETQVRRLPVQGVLRTYHTTKGPVRDADGRIFGVFVISRDFTDETEAYLERQQLLEREKAARAEAERARGVAESSTRALRSLEQITEAALASLDFEVVLHALLLPLREAFSADTIAVSVLDEPRQELVLRAAVGLEEELRVGTRYPSNMGVGGKILMARRAVIFTDFVEVNHVSVVMRDKVKAGVGAPLRVAGRPIGILHVGAFTARQFTDEEAALLQLAADRIALAIEHARLYEQARAATRARDDVLRAVAHDLRSPLNGIVLSAQVLLRQIARRPDLDPLPAQGILAAAEHMNRLIQDLVDLSRIDAGELALTREPLEPQVLVADALELGRPLAEANGLSLAGELSGQLPRVDADRHRIAQVLSNLVGNAIKFTPRGGRVTLVAEPSEGGVRFGVRDTGPGIREEHLPHLFDRFWRANPEDRRGLGLGLAIAQGIVERHGGRIEVESRLGVGSTFHFQLEAAR